MSVLEVTFSSTSPQAATPPPFAAATSFPTFSCPALTTREENSLETPPKRRIRKIAKCTNSTEHTTKDNFDSRWEIFAGSLPWPGHLSSTTVEMSAEIELLSHPFMNPLNGSQSIIGGLQSNPSLFISTPVATHPLVEGNNSSAIALPIKLEDLLSEESMGEQDSESSEETESFVDQEECATLERAESFYHKRLLQRGMRGLIWNVLVQRELVKTIIQQHLRWKLAVLLRKWKSVSKKKQRERLLNAFVLWQCSAQLQRSLVGLLKKKDDCLLAVCFRVWQMKHGEALEMRKAKQHYQLHTVQRLFTAWKVMTHESRSQTAGLVSKADRFHCSKVLEKGFLVWRAWVLHLADCMRKASAKLRKVHIRVLIQKWRELSSSQTVLRLCSERQKLMRERKVLQKCFLVWKEALKSSVTLKYTQNVYRLKCKRSVFEAWRIYVYRCTLKKLGSAYANERRAMQLQVSFNCWLCQAVSVKGEGLLSSRLFTAHHRALLLKAFTGWVTVTRLSQAHSTVKEMHQKRILDVFFQLWKTSWMDSKALQAKRNQMKQLRLTAAFAKWKHCLERCEQEKLAVKYHDLHHIVKAFSTWKVEYQRQASLSNFADLRVHAQLKARFAEWRAAVQLQQEASNLQWLSQFYCLKILRKCFSKWREYCSKQKVVLTLCSKTLQSTLWKLRATSVLKVWSRELQCRKLIRNHLAGKQKLLSQQCFSAWRKLTIDSYMHVSQLFFTKVQIVLNSELQVTASIVTKSCLDNISSNLAIPLFHHSVVTNTDLCQMQATRLGEFPSVFQQSAACLHSSCTDGAEARHRCFCFESTPIVSSDLQTLQSLSNPIPSSLSEPWEEHHDLSCQWPPCQEMSTSDHIPVNRQLFASSGHVGESCISGADDKSCAQLNFCSCLDSKIVGEIQEVQQKLSQVSATLDESAVGADFSNIMGTCHSSENTEAFPILPPPPGFALDRAVGHSECVVLNASNDTYLQNAESQLQYELPTSLHQLVHTLRYMRLYPCSKAFNVWKLYSKRKTQLREMLKCVGELSRVKAIRTSFQIWRELSCKFVSYKAVEMQHLAQVCASIMRISFKRWRERTEMMLAYHEAQMKAVMFDNVICMRKGFVQWKMAHQAVAESESTQKYHQTVLLKSIFHCWVRHAVRRHLIRKMFTRWKHAAKVKKQRKQAGTVGKYWILSNAWKTWRVSYIQRKTTTLMTRQKEKEVLRQVLTAWRVAATSH